MFLVAKCFTNSSDTKIVAGDSRISFGWQLKSDRNNTIQQAYRITVMDDEKEVVWDTGKIESSKSINVYYGGSSLESRKEYLWKVTVWNNYEEAAESELIGFEMGFEKAADWRARWIEANMLSQSVKENFNPGKIFAYKGGDPKEIENIMLDPPIVFSKEFSLEDKEVMKVRLYITAHGVYEVELNGEKVGDEYLAPGFITYPKLQYYQTHDITKQIKNSDNEIKIAVADGWYKAESVWLEWVINLVIVLHCWLRLRLSMLMGKEQL